MNAFTLTPLVLASASPARARLLEQAGLAFLVDPAAIDEAAVKARFRHDDDGASACAEALAEAKAAEVSPRHPDATVIGGDQMLVCEGRWFDKPRDRTEARAQLLALRDRRHELFTAFTIFRDGKRLWGHIHRARLTMRAFSMAFLDAYLAALGDQVLSSVGGYHIEGLGAQLFAQVEGDLTAIQGLPLLPLLERLRGAGMVLA